MADEKQRKESYNHTLEVLERLFKQGRITRRQRIMAIPPEQWEEAQKNE